jgi:hypothetical protein
MPPTVFPTGTTIYEPNKCWNGYTVYPTKTETGAVLIDMNGNVVKSWSQFQGYPILLLPEGHVLGGQVGRVTNTYEHELGSDDVVQEDWDGNVLWRFGDADQIEVGGKSLWSARQNHDNVREGCPVGYYVPELAPKIREGKTLILSQKSGRWPGITQDFLPRAARIIEVDWDGSIDWEWMPAEHFEEFGHSEAAKQAIMRWCRNQHCVFLNTASYIGPNKWYEAGDERFHPDNIITDDRGTMVFIISKQTGKIVWKIGPEYTATSALRKLGCLIGPHHAHVIPQGLPGEGNTWNALRDCSRVLEIDPITLEIVWQYTARTAGFRALAEDSKFYSHFEGAAQRLPNGNTLITESCYGRLIEVTRECDIVWEYVSPYNLKTAVFSSDIFRAYRYPYEWAPQLDTPVQRAVIPPANSEFRIEPVEA